jgi:hypothetical protein
MSRPVLYPLRPLESATVRYTAAPHHRRRVTIDHRPLSGITSAMLLDWFTHIGDTMAYGGEIVDRYLAWHPIDHIYWGIARPAPGRWRRRRRPVPHRRGVRRQARVPGRRRRPRRETR